MTSILFLLLGPLHLIASASIEIIAMREITLSGRYRNCFDSDNPLLMNITQTDGKETKTKDDYYEKIHAKRYTMIPDNPGS